VALFPTPKLWTHVQLLNCRVSSRNGHEAMVKKRHVSEEIPFRSVAIVSGSSKESPVAASSRDFNFSHAAS